jgi:hypothetical protein
VARDPMVIRARVRAWLLGIPLLTLEAHITAADENWPVIRLPAPPLPVAALPVSALPVSPEPMPPGRASAGPVPGPASAGRAVSPVPGAGVARARQLVDQGARALEEGSRGRR